MPDADTATLPVAADWWRATRLAPGLHVLIEPHVHVLLQANVFVLEGRDRDLVIDAGMGIAPLKPAVDAVRADPGKPVACFVTHAHVDHVGGAHEFAEVMVHPLDAPALAAPRGSLFSSAYPDGLKAAFEEAGYPALPPLLLEALPEAGWDPAAYALTGVSDVTLVEDGATVDLGDRRLEAIHLPGHCIGQLGLWEAETGTLFGADAIYDGPLIWQAEGMSVPDYIRSFERIRDLPVQVVHGGHDPSFGPDRFREIVDRHLALWREGR